MKLIVCGTNRPNSNSMHISKIIQSMYKETGEETQILDLRTLPWEQINGNQYGALENQPSAMQNAVSMVTKSEGLIMVVPEYNGSYPGVLKHFIDHWQYPESFEFRPVCFVGLGGRFGGLRPVEHLQQVFGYRNAYNFPMRVFISNVWTTLKENEIKDPMIKDLLMAQTLGFQKFCTALKGQGLDACSVNLARVAK